MPYEYPLLSDDELEDIIGYHHFLLARLWRAAAEANLSGTHITFLCHQEHLSQREPECTTPGLSQ